MDCVFCAKLHRTEPPDDLVWRFPNSTAYLGPWRFYQGYCVLVCGTHATEMCRLPSDKRRAYLDEMCLLAEAVENAFRPHKLNLESLGNQVPHLHWHVFPRYLDDPHRLQPVWLDLQHAETDEDVRRRLETGRFERTATIEALRQELRRLGAPGS